MLKGAMLRRGLLAATCALVTVGLGGGGRATLAQSPPHPAPLGPNPSTLPVCATLSIQGNAKPAGPAGTPGVPVCNGAPLARSAHGPHTPTAPARNSGPGQGGTVATPGLPWGNGYGPANPIVGFWPGNTDAEGIYAERALS